MVGDHPACSQTDQTVSDQIDDDDDDDDDDDLPG